MKLFFRKNKELQPNNEFIEINSDEQLLKFFKEYTLQLDSLLIQQRITKKDYELELKIIDNELKLMEEKYDIS